jgi:hypothetical protein
MAAVYTSDGGGIDGSCVVAQRAPALSRAAVATSSRIVRVSQEDKRPTTRNRCVYKQERRAAQGADNPLRDLMTGCWVPLRRLKRGLMELSAPSRYATIHRGHAALLSGEGCHTDQRGGVVGRLQAQKRAL